MEKPPTVAEQTLQFREEFIIDETINLRKLRSTGKLNRFDRKVISAAGKKKPSPRKNPYKSTPKDGRYNTRKSFGGILRPTITLLSKEKYRTKEEHAAIVEKRLLKLEQENFQFDNPPPSNNTPIESSLSQQAIWKFLVSVNPSLEPARSCINTKILPETISIEEIFEEDEI